MLKKYYIALYLMGISNENIILIINNFTTEDLKLLFKGKELLNLQFKYNINIEKYIDKFNDSQYIMDILKRAKDIEEKSKRLKIKIIPYNNKFYPKVLKEINNPPAILYLKGKYINKKDEKSVACVGARNINLFGKTSIEAIVPNLVNEKFTIISGLAEGVDAKSHNICLENNGRTIAVLAHGLDMIYPEKNKELAQAILENGGTLISEYPVTFGPEKYRFVNRNRIIAGLAKAVIIFQSKVKSGSMHTVNFALENDKKVFAPYPAMVDESVTGLAELIKLGKAIPIRCKNDYRLIINALNYRLNRNLKQTKDLKNAILSNLVASNIYNEVEELDKNKSLSFYTNEESYKEFKKFLIENNLSSSEFFNAVILKYIK
ncbi:DNA-processing protein DprA [Clostridium massiliamazoniense]|uniref:DNA-processing protein DprA n=1 Tax=Clostridium massiliamazoniense TaxID=1347366 RepID=UPI0006D79EDC|nr:DNA-processing protein DprA [Clostridium massiliamazoniense]